MSNLSEIMIDNRITGWNKMKYNKLPECLNNMLDISEIKVNTNVNLNIIKNINNENIYNSKLVDGQTLASSWFQPNLSRDQASSILKTSQSGKFIVRRSSSCDAFVLSMTGMKEGDILHLLLHTSQSGVRFQGSQKIFPNIYSLVLHLSIMRESLPCNLILNPSDIDTENANDHDDDLVDIEKEPQLEIIIAKMQKKMVWG